MSGTARVGLLALLAFFLPVIVVGYRHWNVIRSHVTVDAKTARGKVLYFTAPT